MNISARVFDHSANFFRGLLGAALRPATAFAVLIAVGGCIPIPVHHEVPSETEEQTTFTGAEGLRTAPYYHKAQVRKFEKALQSAAQDLVIVPGTELWRHAFPERDPDAEATLGELLDAERRRKLQALDVHCLVLLKPLSETSVNQKNLYLGVLFRGSGVKTARVAAIVADLKRGELLTDTEATARGKTSATWAFVPLPLVSFFYLDSQADTEESAVDGLARALGIAIAERYPGEPRRVVVMGTVGQASATGQGAGPAQRVDGGGLAERPSYPRPRPDAGQTHAASEAVFGVGRESWSRSAEQGNVEAQLQLYWLEQSPERLQWLCRAADQGHPDARDRLGLLYEKGIETLPQDPEWAYVWYRLAASKGHTAAWCAAERLHSAMTAEQAQRAERGVADWKPGQCEAGLGGGAQAETQGEVEHGAGEQAD